MKGVQYTPSDYLAVTLPSRPCLAPWATLLELEDGRLQFCGAEFDYALRNDLLIEAFHTIQPLLDGNHNVDEIANAGGNEILPTTIVFLLKILRAHGLLQQSLAPSLDSAPSGAFHQGNGEIQFFSHFVSDAPGSLDKLQQSRVGVVGAKSLKDSVETSLFSVGIEQVIKIGISSANPESKTLQSRALMNFLKGVDFLIACQDAPAYSFFEIVNAACLEAKKPWLHLAIEGTKALLGPTFIPHQSACYVCFDKRLASNVPDLETHAAYQKQLAAQPHSSNEGVFQPLWSVLAAQAAMEVSRNLSGYAPPVTIGRFYEMPSTSPVAVGHDVLRLPRCPACNPKRPRHEAWDSTSPVKNNGNH
ncbi:TOMM precursor leader peptide-binding protein [Nitrospina gracilis]|uniref:TOMM precursor leader peptide-binding protein n=1 Tax=Nitrospina gracilis TaxID=35801 RepID=UPI001F15DB8E|nr:TOMM precursor leader peptide-binding protein [Nitrospina gracilis]MCF8719465.1 bacteriocin biosynthesis cyclodehydratase domain-containing protein [Nitrospina gracilis Nb-211]